MCMVVFSECMPVHPVCLVSLGVTGSPGIEVPDSCELPSVFWGFNSGPQGQQLVLLTTEPLLQLPVYCFGEGFKNDFMYDLCGWWEWHTCGGQRTTQWNHFSSSIFTWVPGIGLLAIRLA